MSTRISVEETIVLSRDGSWIGADRHGVDIPEGGTFVLSTFTEADHYPDGYLKDGIPVGKITSGGDEGKFGLFDPDTPATDGRQSFYGVILDPAVVKAGDTEVVTVVYIHGGVKLAQLGLAAGDTTVTATHLADAPANVWAAAA